VHFPQLVQGAGPFVPALVARLEIAHDHDDRLVGMDGSFGHFLRVIGTPCSRVRAWSLLVIVSVVAFSPSIVNISSQSVDLLNSDFLNSFLELFCRMLLL